MKPALLKVGKKTTEYLSCVAINSDGNRDARIYYIDNARSVGGVSIHTDRADVGAATGTALVADTV